jgi:hypothetical protein
LSIIDTVTDNNSLDLPGSKIVPPENEITQTLSQRLLKPFVSDIDSRHPMVHQIRIVQQITEPNPFHLHVLDISLGFQPRIDVTK